MHSTHKKFLAERDHLLESQSQSQRQPNVNANVAPSSGASSSTSIASTPLPTSKDGQNLSAKDVNAEAGGVAADDDEEMDAIATASEKTERYYEATTHCRAFPSLVQKLLWAREVLFLDIFQINHNFNITKSEIMLKYTRAK